MPAGKLLLDLHGLVDQLNDRITLLTLNLQRLAGDGNVDLILNLRLLDRTGCCNCKIIHSGITYRRCGNKTNIKYTSWLGDGVKRPIYGRFVGVLQAEKDLRVQVSSV